MVSKIALFVASLAASLALAGALAMAGFAPGTTPATAATPIDAATTTADVAAQPQVQVDTVYLAPPAKQQTITVHKVVKTAGGESEREEDDD